MIWTVWPSITQINTLLLWWSCQPLKSCINCGYFIHTVKGNDIWLMLDSQIVESRGCNYRITLHANGRAHFQIWNPANGFEFVCTAWTFEWDRWIVSICKIQGLLRRERFIKLFNLNPGDPFDIRKIKTFLKSYRALMLPNDILNMLIVSYIETGGNSRNFHLHKSPIRRIKTKSFKQRFRIERQFTFANEHIDWKLIHCASFFQRLPSCMPFGREQNCWKSASIHH